METRIDVDEENRRIYLFGDVDNHMSLAMCSILDVFDSQSHEEITIIINSSGGSAYDMFGIVDRMMLCKSPLKTVGVGLIASAATLILAAGTPGRRFLTDNCMVMMHELQWGTFADLKALDNLVKTAHQMEDRYLKLMSRFTKKPVQHIKKYTVGQDFWMYSKEAIKNVGLADHICRKRDI